MATTPDIATLLRQQQVLADLSKVTQQSPTADIVNFGRPAAPSGGSSQQQQLVPPPPIGGGLVQALSDPKVRMQNQQAVGNNPAANIQAARNNIMQGIANRITGANNPPSQAVQDANARAIAARGAAPPPNAPTMINATPTNQPSLMPGQAITQDANGQIQVASNVNVPTQQDYMLQSLPTQQRIYDPSMLAMAGQ